MDRQVREAHDAGIDGFIASWSGTGTDTDANFARLLDIAAKHNFSVTIYFETNTAMQHGDVAAQLQSVISRYGNHPAFLHSNGKPVIFVWSPQSMGNAAAWKAVRQKVDPNNSQLWSVDTTDASYLDAFDTIHFFSAGKWAANTDVAKVNAQWSATIHNYNKQHGTSRLWTAGVTPDWDESRVQPPRSDAKVFPRRDGALYEEAWRGATASNPAWITITSYNEWFEGTEIEPAASFGARYLDLTRQYANLWKYGPSPCDGGTHFVETGRTICKPLEAAWQKNGGLLQFGYPISDAANERSPDDGKTYLVQYFERARFELHPENAGTPYEVLISQLGSHQYKKAYPNGPHGQKQNKEGGVLFPETGKWVGGAFRQRWEQNGGLFVNGFPISDEFEERAADGKMYTVQYFERARFEFHPENPAPYNVLLGMLGRQAMDAR
ncbi:MAG: endo-1,3-alpha-glucanase family glycosylhydrolase [Chloroflexota bacterium]